MFQFEGHCGVGPLKDLTAAGEVEVLDRDEVPGVLSDHWKSVPENVEGYAFLMEHDDLSIQPSMGITLYCQESALDWIYRAFSVAAFSRSGGVGLELQVQFPNNLGGPFWQEQWRREWLLVSSWKIFAGTQMRPAQ